MIPSSLLSVIAFSLLAGCAEPVDDGDEGQGETDSALNGKAVPPRPGPGGRHVIPNLREINTANEVTGFMHILDLQLETRLLEAGHRVNIQYARDLLPGRANLTPNAMKLGDFSIHISNASGALLFTCPGASVLQRADLTIRLSCGGSSTEDARANTLEAESFFQRANASTSWFSSPFHDGSTR
jgi:hypothetical protein